jgi:protoheme IX farnesyltransferase
MALETLEPIEVKKAEIPSKTASFLSPKKVLTASKMSPSKIDLEQDALIGDERILIRRDKHRKSSPSFLTDLWELTKPEITTFVAISAIAGFVLGSTQGIDFIKLIYTLIGVCLSSGGGAVFNHVLERNYDLNMRRTQKRPLPSGRISPKVAILYGSALSIAGVSVLYFLTNGFTAILAAQTIFLYVAIYTPLKRMTTLNTLMGTIPGALPALGGWTAATNYFDWGGGLLFAIMIVWQMPHFLAVAWMYRKDYERGGFKMTPIMDKNGSSTAWQMVGYTIVLSALCVTMTLTHVTSWLFLVGMIVVCGYFLMATISFFQVRSHKNARKVLLASVMFIPALLGLIALDRLI